MARQGRAPLAARAVAHEAFKAHALDAWAAMFRWRWPRGDTGALSIRGPRESAGGASASEEIGWGGVPTRIWNAGLASDGISRENVVRRVLSAKDEWNSACERRRWRALEIGDIEDGRVS